MVRAPEVNEQRVAALDLIDVVCDIGSQVGESAVAFAQDAVFLIAVVGALEPERAVFFVGEPHVRHAVEGRH